MAKSKKTKIHKRIDGQLCQMNKAFGNLKMNQKDKTERFFKERGIKFHCNGIII